MRITLIVLTLSFGVTITNAQHASPYADLQSRPIKALSEQQISDLRTGRGMGFALAAELNGYPGPLHVIEFASKLELSAEQRQRMDALFASMKAEATALGEALIGEEAALDRLFASREISTDALIAATNKIGATQAALRAAHLMYHLATVEVLNPVQVEKYAELRGYKTTQPMPEHKHRH
jgi:Spy/CpxP family protein refolding chaperone